MGGWIRGGRGASVLLAAVLLAAVGSVVAPPVLTDGDSCLYAALATEMAKEGGGAWVAPSWAQGGGRRCFHENPPLSFWLAGIGQRIGLSRDQAPAVSQVIWMAALLAAVHALAGGGLAGAAAATALLLMLPVLRVVGRFPLELPYAACLCACVAFARRPGRALGLAAGAAFAGALLSRGVFGFAAPLLVAADGRLRTGRASSRRVLLVVVVGLAGAAAFDGLHALARGHSFWAGHWQAQLFPSLQENGTPHPNQGSTLLYYGSRLLLYGLPWWLLILPALRDRARRRSLSVYLLWIGIFLLGSAIARRQGSRYLFGAWPALAVAFGLAAAAGLERWPARVRAALPVAPWLLFAGVFLGARWLRSEDAWDRTASAVRAWADSSELPAPSEAFGDFAPHDDRAKQFLRHHAGIWTFSIPEEGLPQGAWRVQRSEDVPPPKHQPFVAELFWLEPPD